MIVLKRVTKLCCEHASERGSLEAELNTVTPPAKAGSYDLPTR